MFVLLKHVPCVALHVNTGLTLTPLNKQVDDMNSRILEKQDGDEFVYFSADYFAEDAEELELNCLMQGINLVESLK